MSGTTVTYTTNSGSTGTITTQDTTYSNATGITAGLMSSLDKSKLDTIDTYANAYELPVASSSELGGVKVGGGLSIDQDGVLSAGSYALPTASASQKGGVKIGSGLTMTGEVLSANVQSTNDFTSTEKTKLAGIAEGANNYTLPTAASNTKGGVKIGTGLTMNGEVLSATTQSDNNYTTTEKEKLAGIEASANNYSLPTASSSTKGGVKIGTGLDITEEVLSVPEMVGATSSADGISGIVPAPVKSARTKYLRGDGEWETPTDEKVKISTFGTSDATAYPIMAVNASSPSSSYAYTAGIPTTSAKRPTIQSSTGLLTAAGFSGVGTNLTDLNASNLGSGTVPSARLPVATASAVGGVMVGGGLSITDGVLAADVQSVPAMTGATSNAAGTAGTVPAPAAGDDGKVLCGTGTWEKLHFSHLYGTQGVDANGFSI